MNVILVSTGVFQRYILDNIKQLLLFNYNIIVITEKKFFSELNEYPQITKIDSVSLTINYDKKTKLNSKFREGFWVNCSKRLFLIYEYMKNNNITNCIHLENDVILYADLTSYFKNDNKNIYITMDHENRCIPGIMYIPNYTLLNNLINNYNYSENDMKNIAKFYNSNKDICKTFPIINENSYFKYKNMYNDNFSEFNSIFDAAAIGQYLGGVDPWNISGDTCGFINETCVVKYNNYKFKWIQKNEYFYPHIIIDEEVIPIINLHIHSKRLKDFLIMNPIKNKYIDI